MNMTLRNADARAVDLILDRAVTAQGSGGATLFAGDPGVSGEQVAAVEKVLKLLDAMPAAEPPADLLRRTLDRVDGGYRTYPLPDDHEFVDARPVA